MRKVAFNLPLALIIDQLTETFVPIISLLGASEIWNFNGHTVMRFLNHFIILCLCFFYSTVHLISPLVENLSREGIKTYSRLSALSVVGFVPRWMLVECMKNKYWLGDLSQIMTVHRIWEGSHGFHGNSSATVSSIQYGKLLKGSLVKFHNEPSLYSTDKYQVTSSCL